MSNPVSVVLDWGSKLQIQSIGLRYEVLRRPLGLFFSPSELAEEENQINIAVVKGDRVLAVLLLKILEGNVAKMRQVAVSASFQGQGLGKQLVRFSEELCRQKNVIRIELHARKTAIPFYLSLGYEAEGPEFEEVGIPHRKMYLEL
ncbi:MAG: GNAT family N-acetyltransferase [Sphingomonadales bacterium]|jgi:predicted GNAT family N-acyltransferase